MQYIPNYQYTSYGVVNDNGFYTSAQCVIKVITNRYDKIINAEVDGNDFGCYHYIKKMQN